MVEGTVTVTTFCISLVVVHSLSITDPSVHSNHPFTATLLFLIAVCVCTCACHIADSERRCSNYWLLLFTTPGFASVPLKISSLCFWGNHPYLYTSCFPGLFAAVISQMKIQLGCALAGGLPCTCKTFFARFDNHHLGSDSFIKRCFVLANCLSYKFSHYGR